MTHAFFDLDETLITAQSQALLLNTFRKHKYISWLATWRLRLFFVSYKLHLVSRSNLDTVYEMVAKILKGLDVVEIERVVEEFVFKIFPHLENKAAVAELKKHILDQHVIVLTSSAFEPMVKAAAKYFNIPTYRCTKLEIVNGKYSGKLDGLPNYGAEKIRKMIDFDFNNSYGYSDHQSDIPILEKTAHPYAVSPTRKMKKFAEDHNWPILK